MGLLGALRGREGLAASLTSPHLLRVQRYDDISDVPGSTFTTPAVIAIEVSFMLIRRQECWAQRHQMDKLGVQ